MQNLNGRVQESQWADYCRRRNGARLSLVVLVVFLGFLIVPPPQLTRELGRMPPIALLLAFFAAIVVFVAPVLRWVEWRCPQCGSKFAQGQTSWGWLLTLIPVLLRLFVDAHCRNCGWPD
jgi:hypothetical protein